jgi:uncharacterized caspase-like protein
MARWRSRRHLPASAGFRILRAIRFGEMLARGRCGLIRVRSLFSQIHGEAQALPADLHRARHGAGDRRSVPAGGARRWAGAMLAVILVMLIAPAEARRLALVVGNDNYKSVQPLKNARQDAKAIAEALKGLGFDVTLKQDLTLNALKAALREFKSRVSGGDEVIFYFSGHGVQFEGTNYLVPIDIVAESEQQVADDAVPLQRVLDDLRDQKARFSLAIVDACRDNPFKGQGRAIGGRGLAPVQAANGQMVLYSAGAGQAALDRLGSNDADPNGVFTRVLIRQINRPGVPVDRMLKNVRDEVVQLAKSANHEQVPALYDQSIGEFYFRPGAAEAPVRPSTTPVSVSTAPAPSAVQLPSAGELEQSFWGRIKDSSDVEDFKDYGRQFPKGAHAAEAALMVRKLTRQMSAAQAPAPAVESATRARPEPLATTQTTSAATSGSHPGYITSSLQPGVSIKGAMVVNNDGSFFYRGANGIVLRGALNLANLNDITGTGTAVMPKALGILQTKYPDGSTTTAVTLRARVVNGVLQGQYADRFETGQFVFDLNQHN